MAARTLAAVGEMCWQLANASLAPRGRPVLPMEWAGTSLLGRRAIRASMAGTREAPPLAQMLGTT